MSDLPAAIEEVEDGWSPRGEVEIEHALRGLERAAVRFQKINDQADIWAADIEAWRRTELGKLRGPATRIALGLQAWAREKRIISKGRDKSFVFPSGTISTRAGRGKAEVTDEAALLKWCEENTPQAVKVTKTVLTSVLLKVEGVEIVGDGLIQRLVAVGEIIPGIQYLAAGESRITSEVALASQRALPAATE